MLPRGSQEYRPERQVFEVENGAKAGKIKNKIV
jgi:hypothetical protein